MRWSSDSFSSGVGTRVYDPASGACQRSRLAYPALAAALRHEALTFLACSGATTDDVVLKQVPDLPTAARLVTITVDGDDVGFAAVLTACSSGGTQEACTTASNTALAALGDLSNRLGLTYNAIHNQAPRAKLVVLGYFHIFGSGSCTRRACRRSTPGLPSTRAPSRWIR